MSDQASDGAAPLEERVLIVDDEREIRQMLSRQLTHEGVQVRTVGSGAEALETMAKWRAGVVVTDMTMPGMNGVELLRMLRERYPETRAIIMTGRAHEASVVQAMQLGADACALKPLVDLDDFVRLVRHSQAVLAHWVTVLDTVRVRARSLRDDPSGPTFT